MTGLRAGDRIRCGLLVALLAIGFSLTCLTNRAYAGTDDYPAQWRNAAQDSLVDTWGYYNRECTSFVAWRLHARNGFEMPRAIGNADAWGSWARSHGVRVDMNPAVGAVAWWSSGHVAWVEAAGGGQVTIEEYNRDYQGHYGERSIPAGSVSGYIHFKDVSGTPPPPTSPPGAVGAISVLEHGSRVNLRWGAASGASDYQVFRDGLLLAVVTDPTYLDLQVSPKQAYTYSVAAHNSGGTSASPSVYVQTNMEAADRAYLPTKDGPALCARAGDQTSQAVVCNVLTGSGWVSRASTPNDWGYAADRSWIDNAGGSVSYCRRVGTGDQVTCDRFDGANWTSSTSPHLDFGYADNRAYLPTKDGPAVCARAGDQTSQALICDVLTASGWISQASAPGDWGYATDRAWMTNADGTVSYCRRVGTGDQVTCDRFDGAAWTSSTSPHLDGGYPDTF